MNRIVYKSDYGHRKGCHPLVFITEKWDGRKKKTVTEETTLFLIDEPGAWFDDEWNCHVDGTDYHFKTKEECICWGLYVLGYLQYEK